MSGSLGSGTIREFIEKEFESLDLKDKRLNQRAKTILNFTKHKAKSDLRSIGKSGKTIQYGLIQHSILSVTDHNEPLGLLE